MHSIQYRDHFIDFAVFSINQCKIGILKGKVFNHLLTFGEVFELKII